MEALTGGRLRIGAVAPVYRDADRTLEAMGKWLDLARSEGCHVVALPQECVLLPGEGEPIPGPASRALAAMARHAGLYVAANLREADGGGCYLTSFLLSPEGEVLCRYRKTHGYAWERERIALGDDLPVFDTPLGKVAFLVGSDLHFPEAAMVVSWLGARLLFWATEPEPVRDVHRYEQILRIRAMDELLTIVASDYAGASAWYSHSVRSGRVGVPLGRSCVVTPAGEFAADTGYGSGLAVATVSLPPPGTRPLYLYPRSGTYLRQYDCRVLAEPAVEPATPSFRNRAARIVLHPGGPADRTLADVLGREKPDLVLLPEYGGPGWLEGTPALEDRNLPALKALARDHRCYVVAGGIQGETWSMACVFDRAGEILGRYAQTTFGLGRGIRVFDTDFCRMGVVVCNDLMFPEIARAEFLMGAEMLLCPSQFACPSGMHNHRILAARAIDNAAYCGVVLPCNEDPWQRVAMADPYGVFVAQGAFRSPGVPVVAEVDFSRGVVGYVPPGRVPLGDAEGRVPPECLPVAHAGLAREIRLARRPDLYRCLLDPGGPNPIYAPGRGPTLPPCGENLALGKPCSGEPPPEYRGHIAYRLYGRPRDLGDASRLTDGGLATGALGDGRWAVWTREAGSGGRGEVRVTVDLEETRAVEGVAVHLLSHPDSGCPFPALEVETSGDGRRFIRAAVTDAAAQGYLEPPGWPRVDWFVIHAIGRSARYVRFVLGFAGGATHMAVDQVAVYGKQARQ